MRLSREWTIISALMYGQSFIDELANFLRQHGVSTILDCGCGGGDVLEGLAEQGLTGIGIDASREMIEIAKAEHAHPAIKYRHLDWRKAASLGQRFDCVLCRGNSLISAISWENHNAFSPETYPEIIKQSLGAMLAATQDGGLLYLDVISQREIDRGGEKVRLNFPEVHLEGEIIHDWQNRTRTVRGEGWVYGEYFTDCSTFYLMSPDELEGLLVQLGVSKVFRPHLAHEINYDIICAIK